ncbi:MAG: hypothetical protein ABFQ64_07600 [Campylobacterota bacterium]
MKKLFLLLVSSLLVLGTSSFAKDISAYLIGAHADVETVKNRLSRAGFEVVAEYAPVQEGTTIVFTNSALKAEAAKEKRAHAAVLRVFVDDQEKVISITNPVYFGRAFMQDDYDSAVYEAQLTSINSVFKALEGSVDKLDEDDIAGFHFTFGMPYYEDPDELGEGSNSELLAKAQAYNGGKNVIFTLKLSDKSTLVGYEIGEETKGFIKDIGRANAAVLPYCISIEDEVATALAAKYYLAISYPLLSMGEFMTISSVPGEIADDLTKPFE